MSDGVNSAVLQHLDSRFGEIRERMDREADRASESRSLVFKRLEKQGADIAEVRHEVERLKDAYADAAPTLKEYREMRQKAVGAGFLGRLLWRAGGWVLSAAVAIYAGWEWIAAALKAAFLSR